MNANPTHTTAAQQYAEAYAAQYTRRDLLAAVRSYSGVISQHAGALEAGYSRAQIVGIMNQVVPPEELLASQTELALRHLAPESDRSVVADPTSSPG